MAAGKTASGLSLRQLQATSAAAGDDSTAAHWAPIIRADLSRSVAGIISTGQDFAAAKAACAHGEFGKLFDAECGDYVGITQRSAQMLMLISEHEVLANTNTASYLPSSWTTLYELSRHEPATVESWISDGLVKPETTRGDILKLGRPDPPPAPTLPTGTYDVILADPPWRYDEEASGQRLVRSMENQYPTMSLDDIIGMDVGSLAADDAVLFCWATATLLPDALRVLDAWGFAYRTHFVWVKDSIGMGLWVRHQHELLLIGRRGRMRTPEPADRPSSVIAAPRLAHSQKPDVVYDLIETMYPDHTYVELFARSQRESWSSWGNQLP